MTNNTHSHWWLWPMLVVVALALLWAFLFRWFDLAPVLLWSDTMIALLIVFVLYVVAYIRTKEHLRAPWREVFHRKLAMVALVVMSVYVVIGMLDSIHFRMPLQQANGNTAAASAVQHETKVTSLFDVIAKPLRTRQEHTYSAPFAAYLHAKESIELPDGTMRRDYPRLVYGGAHLTDPKNQLLPDILMTVLQAVLLSLVIWIAVVALLTALLAYAGRMSWRDKLLQIWHEQTVVPWRVVFGTVGVMLFIVVALVLLSADYHVFGTDKVGQDVLFLSLKSIRTGMLIGTLATLVMLPFAVMLGMMAGYFRGIVDDIIQYVYTTLSSIPFVLLIAAAVLSIHVYIDAHKEKFGLIEYQSDLRLVALCVILGVTSWTSLCRLLRGETMKVREVDYIQAAKALGVGHFRIMTRHVLPNVMHIVLITIVLDFSGLVLAEAVLSYIGIGVDQSTSSWGNMINSARLELAREPMVWWPLLSAFVLMFVLVLFANLFADAVRDAFDPKLRKLTGGAAS